MGHTSIEKAKERFGVLIETEITRVRRVADTGSAIDFTTLNPLILGILPGDGIGPIIMKQTLRVLDFLVGENIRQGRIVLRHIGGLDIETRAAKKQSVPEDSLCEVKKCHVLLKGPMTTPRLGDPWPNLISANSVLRRELDLFSNIRPISIPERGIDWTFFRENIEGAYIWGNKGIQVDADLAIDFVIETRQGSKRIARAAFEFARKNGKSNVTAVTKANIVKLTDGNFLSACREVAKDYPEIRYEERLVDITAAKLSDPEFNKGLQVFVLPNLYGDIVSDVAAEIQGSVGTAGSANLGSRYALFEAIHGTAPFLMQNSRGEYADPSSLLQALALLLSHVGYQKQSNLLAHVLDVCGRTERKLVVTSLPDGASTEEYASYILETLKKTI